MAQAKLLLIRMIFNEEHTRERIGNKIIIIKNLKNSQFVLTKELCIRSLHIMLI